MSKRLTKAISDMEKLRVEWGAEYRQLRDNPAASDNSERIASLIEQRDALNSQIDALHDGSGQEVDHRMQDLKGLLIGAKAYQDAIAAFVQETVPEPAGPEAPAPTPAPDEVDDLLPAAV